MSIKIRSLSSFLNWDVLPRCQEIEEKEQCDFKFILSVSYRWQSREHPDPESKVLNKLKEYIMFLLEKYKDFNFNKDFPGYFKNHDFIFEFPRIFKNVKDIGIFIDYSCIPQIPRTELEEKVFLSCISNLNAIYTNSLMIIVSDKQYFTRSWCMSECLTAIHKDEYINLSLLDHSDCVDCPSDQITKSPDYKYLTQIRNLRSWVLSDEGVYEESLSLIHKMIYNFKNNVYRCSYESDRPLIFELFKKQLLKMIQKHRTLSSKIEW